MAPPQPVPTVSPLDVYALPDRGPNPSTVIAVCSFGGALLGVLMVFLFMPFYIGPLEVIQAIASGGSTGATLALRLAFAGVAGALVGAAGGYALTLAHAASRRR